MGSNQSGKLGLTQNNDLPQLVNTPKLVEILANNVISKVSCGLNHALAVTRDSGIVYSWGSGTFGQLGRDINLKNTANLPAVVSQFIRQSTRIREVSAGGKHSLFLSDEGQVFGAGSNEFCQLGFDTKKQIVEEPRLVKEVKGKVTQIACGLFHSQMLTFEGSVLSCGDNQFGQLGIGQGLVNDMKTPIAVKLPKIVKIACNHHSAAIG